jgi:hypothetical protein
VIQVDEQDSIFVVPAFLMINAIVGAIKKWHNKMMITTNISLLGEQSPQPYSLHSFGTRGWGPYKTMQIPL